MRVAKRLLLFGLSALLVGILGCNGKTQVIKEIVYVPVYKPLVDCDVPTRPVLLEPSKEEHIGSIKNVQILQNNLLQLMLYSQAMEETMGCFKSQTNSTLQSKEMTNERLSVKPD